MDPLTSTKCHETHDPSWFSRDYWRRRKGSRTPWCKPCLRAAARERRTGLTQEEFAHGRSGRMLRDLPGRVR